MSRCPLPFYPDPGQPQQPLAGQKLYLVMGRECDLPGAFVSWPSAGAQYNKFSSATLKTYSRWSEAESAWWAGCDRGEHGHPGQATTPMSPSSRTTGAVPAAASPSAARTVHSQRRGAQAATPVPLVIIASRTPSPVAPSTSNAHRSGARQPRSAAEAPLSPTKGKARAKGPARNTASAPASAPQGRMVYAVRALDDLTGGVVFSDYAAARAWYNEKQAAGLDPTMVTGHSLTTAVNFTERFPPEQQSAEGRRRRDYVDEENRARRKKVALSLQRAQERQTILENLAAARQGCEDESDHPSDESDLSRSTSSLASELEARWSYGDEWRYYRSDGEHGKT
ncbi:hypothetical protein C8F04DRAFT_1274890 [Mycena alexandri]|uniref:Uncharacterized protein n=1 Tax=Mycena alexandri TaxID=1745969 RepID=A0AAD6WPR8_9AGAR|nr:hypothetical protein C8F04DRAFT_1274890 [Mycena alexandri]